MRTLLLLLAIAAPAFGQPPMPDAPKPAIVLSDPGKVAPGKLARVSATTAAKRVTWRVPQPVDFEPSADSMRIVCTAPVGVYSIEACCVDADGNIVFAACKLIVESPIPPPPAPPPDTLRTDLQLLAAAETGPQRSDNLKRLAALYRQAATIAGQAADPAALAKQVHDAADTLLPAASMLKLRDRVRAELAKIGDPSLPADWQKRAADVYARAAAAIEEAAK